MKWKRGKKAQQEARLAAQQQLKQQQQQQQQLNASSTSTGSTRIAPVPLMLTRPSYAPTSSQAQFNMQEAGPMSLLPLHQQAGGQSAAQQQHSAAISSDQGINTALNSLSSPAHSPALSAKSSSSSPSSSSSSSSSSLSSSHRSSVVSSKKSRTKPPRSPPLPLQQPAAQSGQDWHGQQTANESSSKLGEDDHHLATPNLRDEFSREENVLESNNGCNKRR